MAKRFINKTQLQDAYDRGAMTFTVTKDMILSQTAMDFAREHQISLVYGSEPKGAEQMDLKEKVRAILKSTYKIEDDAILSAIMARILK